MRLRAGASRMRASVLLLCCQDGGKVGGHLLLTYIHCLELHDIAIGVRLITSSRHITT